MIPFGLIAAGIGAGIKLIKAGHQNKLANQVVVPEANYSVSPYAENTLALAKQMYNSKMPGADIAGNGFLASNAIANANIGRNSTDSSQALALMAATQGQTDQSFTDLGLKDAQYRENAFSNVNSANAGMTNEMDKIYQDKVRKQQQALDEKAALRGAANANFGNSLNDITSGAFMFDQMQNKKKN